MSSSNNHSKFPCAVIPNQAFVLGTIFTSMLLTDVIIPRASPDANLLEDGVTVTEYYAAATIMHVIILATVLMLYYPPSSRRVKMDRVTVDDRAEQGRKSPVAGMACVADTQHMKGKSAIDPVTTTIIAYAVLKLVVFFTVNVSKVSQPQTRQIIRLTAAIVEIILMFAFISNMRETARTDAIRGGVIANTARPSVNRRRYNQQEQLNHLLRQYSGGY